MTRGLVARFLAALLLLSFFALALTSAIQKSPTMDEQNHIARGAAYLGTGDPRLSVEHPPLVNVLSALPAHLLLDLTLPLDTVWWEAGEWYHFADLFLWQVNGDFRQIVFLARLPIIGLGMLLVSLVFRWASEILGPWGGLVAALFCGLDPNILAHTRLATTDLGGTFFIFFAAYAFWRLLSKPSVGRVIIAGLALGLAFSAKLYALLFAPIFACLLLVRWWRKRDGVFLLRAAGLMTLLAGIALFVVWGVYGFQVGSLNGGEFVVPAAPYIKGVKAILSFAGGGRPGYLLGDVSKQGWWYYFLVAFLVKTPLPTLLALGLAIYSAIQYRIRSLWGIAWSPLLYFLVLTFSRLNLGYRHLLPVLPFLAVYLGRLSDLSGGAIFAINRLSVGKWITLFLGVALVVSTLVIYPHFLSYFNPIAGGAENGWHVLVDSNIDWGQDVELLRRWVAEEGIGQIRLGLFGTAHPEAYGIDCILLPGTPHGGLLWNDPPFDPNQPEPGIYVISVTNLVGLNASDGNPYAWFRSRSPDEKIGYSLFVYKVGNDE